METGSSRRGVPLLWLVETRNDAVPRVSEAC